MVKVSHNTEVKGLIFKELIRKGYSLEGKSKVWNIADSKLWYVTPKQLQYSEELSEERKFQNDDETALKLIESHLQDIINSINSDSFNFIDLGGAGKNTPSLLESLDKEGFKINYYAVDINSLMLERAKKLFDKVFKKDSNVKFFQIEEDFFKIEEIMNSIRKTGYKKSIVFLGRSTFVNFEPNEILFTIKRALLKEDLFILTSSLFSKEWIKRVKQYKEGGKLDIWLFELLRELGIQRSEVHFLTRFFEKRSEVLYELKVDKEIVFGEERIELKKGDKILVLFSYKHLEEDLMTYLNINFPEISSFKSESKLYKLALCKR